MVNLAALREDSGRAVQRLIRDIEPSSPGPALIRDVGELCLHFHIIAVATLLVDGRPQGFFLNLCRAAENWRRLLAHLRRKGEALPASRYNEPLLGAVAAGQWGLARQVAELSETRRLPEEEYLSEHAWAQLLQALLAFEAPQKESVRVLLEALEEAGGEESQDRIALARALLELDEQGFVRAFNRAVLVRSESIEKKAKLFTTPVTKFAPQRSIWMEGLALLRLAERAGFQPYEEHYLYCPPLARVPMSEPFRGDWSISLVS